MRQLRYHIIIMAALLLFLAEAGGQSKGIMFTGGLGSYRMDDMKYYQEYLLGTYPVEGRIISSFPAYTNGSVNYIVQLYPHIMVGGGYGFSSTGAKSNYTDPSGSITTEMIAASHRIGAYISYLITGGEKLTLHLYGRVNANISSIKVSTVLFAGGYGASFQSNYRSVSPNGSAGLELLYRIGDFSLGIEGGYLLDLPGKLSDTDQDDMLYDPVGDRRVLTSEWTGWRSGVKLIIWMD